MQSYDYLTPFIIDVGSVRGISTTGKPLPLVTCTKGIVQVKERTLAYDVDQAVSHRGDTSPL
jgi:hypothetical protein